MHIYNAYTYEEIKVITLSDSGVRSLILSDLDKEFAILGTGNYIRRFSITKPN